jgi:hypothetical protein
VRRISTTLPRLLALVLLFQAVLAPALCIGRAQGSTITMEICGPDGMRSQALDLGDQIPAAGQHGFCAVCAGLPQGAEAATPILPTPVWLVFSPAWPVVAPRARLAQARAPPQQPRAPPVTA